ncbi:hypothetical protein [Vibrio hepatarius]|uniref:hypothetical protein n=1 Tax=Vibrio hepatarius TaxID=171383 RepID=UPI001C095544|nr:hypothetical protein [Vibrio hepatarius]MBU2898327.1 hypothetical protein [Vibrio hepatarius]
MSMYVKFTEWESFLSERSSSLKKKSQSVSVAKRTKQTDILDSQKKERTNKSSVRPLAMMLFNKTDKTDKTNRND